MNRFRNLATATLFAGVCAGTAACSRQQPEGREVTRVPRCTSDTIVGNALGELVPGSRLDQVMAVCSGADTSRGPDAEGDLVLYLRVPIGSTDTIVAEIMHDSAGTVVRNVYIRARRVRTGEGIHVGAMFAQVRAAYPRLELGEGEGTLYAWAVPDRGVSFELSAAADAVAPDGDLVAALARIGDTTTVTAILLRRIAP